jgi:integrase/recombinase XerD
MIAQTLVRSRSSIGSNPASPASSARLAVSSNLVHGVISLAVGAAVRVGSSHSEITPPTNFHQIRDTTVLGLDGKSVSVVNLSKLQTKWNRARRVFVSDELRKLLSQYLASLEAVSDARPFMRSTRTGGHFSNVILGLGFKAIYQAAGIKTISHSGRRTFATRLNAAGIGMRTIQNALGHASIQTTALYCDVSDDQLANAVNAI